jgi:hypothetical protein
MSVLHFHHQLCVCSFTLAAANAFIKHLLFVWLGGQSLGYRDSLEAYGQVGSNTDNQAITVMRKERIQEHPGFTWNGRDQ